MTERQIARIFEIACAGALIRADEIKFEPFKRILGRFDEREVMAALDAWQADVTEIMRFDELRPRGATMPTATELLSLVRKLQHKKAVGTHFTACGLDGCSDGLKLNFRDGRRFVTDCWCLAEWKSAKGPIRTAPTVDAGFTSIVSQLRRVQ